MRLAPFQALRANQHHVTAVSCPPAGLLTPEEATERVRLKARSLMAVLRHSELSGTIDDLCPTPREQLARMIESGAMQAHDATTLHAYRVAGHGHRAIGIVGALDDFTRVSVRHIPALRHAHGVETAARVGATMELHRLVIDSWHGLTPRLLLDLNERPHHHFVEKETGLTHSVWALRDPEPYIEYLQDRDGSLLADAASLDRATPILAFVVGADEWPAEADLPLRLRSGLLGLEHARR